MNVLHINYSDKIGGAAIAAYRHHEAMQKAGIDSNMLVILQSDKTNQSIKTPFINKYLLLLINRVYFLLHSFILRFYKPFASFSIAFGGFSLYNHPSVKRADIIYLHWINASMLSIDDIEKILKTGKNIYWYMHDMYPITGGCHHAFECTKYQNSCHKCPLLFGVKILDVSSCQFKKKIKSWQKYNNLKVITPSKWLADCVSKSTIFKEHEIHVFPNVINTKRFKPINKCVAKELIGVSKSKKIILFGADNINNPYKGWEYLKKAMNKLNPEEYECLVFGTHNQSISSEIKIKTRYTGYLKDDYSLVAVYNAADVFISPSLADNYPNVILEAMACGLPCIGFNVGGIPDLIQHQETGYVSKYKDTNDLVKGINWIFQSDYNLLSEKARSFIVSNCSYAKYEQLNFIRNRTL